MRVKNAEDILSLIDNESMDSILDIDLSDFVGARLKLQGKPFHASITPTVMDGYKAVQDQLYRAYALVEFGEANTRLLSESDRNSLEIVVSVKDGSSDFLIENAEAILKVFQTAMAKMDGNQVTTCIVIMALIATLYVGKGGLSVWTQYQIDKKRIDAATLAEQQQTERLSKAMELAKDNTILRKILGGGERASRAQLTAAMAANSVEIDGNPVATETIKSVLQSEKESIETVRLDGTYRILSMSATEETVFDLKLVQEGSKNPIKCSIKDLLLLTFLADIQSAFVNRKTLEFKINGRRRGDEIISAEVVTINVTPQFPPT